MTRYDITQSRATTRPLGRRALLGSGLAAGAGSLLVAAKPQRPPHRERTLTLDVACRVDTMRLMPVPNATLLVDSPLYGAPFLVEGFVFPAGTIPDGEESWDHTSVTPLGTWLCRGWTTTRDERSEPHVITTQHYHLEPIGTGALSAADMLVSEGLEGGDAPGWSVPRAVIGGTGRFAGARGEVVQHHLGTNTSAAGPGGVLIEAGPNFRFEFRLE